VKVLSPTTVRLLVQTLRSVFNAAVQDRLIASSQAGLRLRIAELLALRLDDVTYGHLMPDSEDRTRRAIDTAWSTSDGPQTAQAP
jgi:hypothetical protein